MSKRIAGPEIERLIQLLAKVPGLGPRSARRAALHLIKKKEQLLAPLAVAMGEAVDKVRVCSTCGNVDTIDPCSVCSDPRRDGSVIIVVEDVADLWALERADRDERPLPRARRHAVAARRHRPRRPQHQDAGGAGRRRRRQGSDHRGQRHGRGPDDGALPHRPARRLRRPGDAAGAWRAGRRRARLSRRGHARRGARRRGPRFDAIAVQRQSLGMCAYVAPLCPAGHLPHKGGDWHRCFRQSTLQQSDRPISPLEGEMSGRTEGGAKQLRLRLIWFFAAFFLASVSPPPPPPRSTPSSAPGWKTTSGPTPSRRASRGRPSTPPSPASRRTSSFPISSCRATKAKTPKKQHQAEFGSPGNYFAEKTIGAVTRRRARPRRQIRQDACRRSRSAYGVPGGVVLAIWGRESGFGSAKMPYDAFEVLGTKAFMSTRKDMFRKEVLAALEIVERGLATPRPDEVVMGRRARPAAVPAVVLPRARGRFRRRRPPRHLELATPTPWPRSPTTSSTMAG